MACAQQAEHIATAKGRLRNRSWMILLIIAPLLLIGAYFGAYYRCRMPGGEVRIGSYANVPEFDMFFYPARLIADGPVRELADAVKRATTDDAERLVDATLKQARAENKRVLLVICTTHCLPCRQLDGLFEELSPILDRHLIVLKLNFDALQNGEQVHQRYRPEIVETAAYIPWMAVLDGAGNVLARSGMLDSPDAVIALPQGSDACRRCFLELLRVAAPSLSEAELKKIDRAAKALHDRIWKVD